MVRIRLLVVVIVLTILFSAEESVAVIIASTLRQSIDSSFKKMKQDFDDVSGSVWNKKQKPSTINSFFYKALQEHQEYFSFSKINKQGSVLQEVIRLVEKPSLKKQSVAKELWFSYVSSKQREYMGLKKVEQTGRYYVFWVQPAIEKTKKGKKLFEGAVTLKIDLWDCFHTISQDTDIPFLIRIDKLHFYSNKWKDTISFVEEPLAVFGVKKIFVRYPKNALTSSMTGGSSFDITRIDTVIRSMTTSYDSLRKVKDAQEKERNTVIIGLLIGLCVILTVLVFILVTILRKRELIRK